MVFFDFLNFVLARTPHTLQFSLQLCHIVLVFLFQRRQHFIVERLLLLASLSQFRVLGRLLDVEAE